MTSWPALYDPLGRRGPITLPDGSKVPRIPGYTRWMWDGEFCGSIGLRWVPGSQDVPPYVLGHVGYAVVPWKRGRGYARQALEAILPDAKAIGLSYVEMTTDPDNVASQRVMLAAGAVLVERFTKPEQYGGVEGLRFRISSLTDEANHRHAAGCLPALRIGGRRDGGRESASL